MNRLVKEWQCPEHRACMRGETAMSRNKFGLRRDVMISARPLHMYSRNVQWQSFHERHVDRELSMAHEYPRVKSEKICTLQHIVTATCVW
jgi:hypothetical protein